MQAGPGRRPGLKAGGGDRQRGGARRRTRTAEPDGPEFRRSLKIAARRLGNSILLDVQGELDVATAPRLFEVAARLGPAADVLIVDLTELAFIDSSGLAALDRIHREVTRRMRILSGHGSDQLFAITNAGSWLPIATKVSARTG